MEELTGLALPLVFLAVLYLLLIRPQQKRRKEQQQMIRELQIGDDVVTISGLYGRVVGLGDSTMDLTVDAEGENILRFERGSLARIVNDPLPVDDLDEDLATDTTDTTDTTDEQDDR